MFAVAEPFKTKDVVITMVMSSKAKDTYYLAEPCWEHVELRRKEHALQCAENFIINHMMS